MSTNPSSKRERDHKATRGPTKQQTRACAKATENQPIVLQDSCSRFTPIWRVQSQSDQRSHSLCNGSGSQRRRPWQRVWYQLLGGPRKRRLRQSLVVKGQSWGHLLLNGPRVRRLWQRVCYQLLSGPRKRRLRQSMGIPDKILGHWTLMGPGTRWPRIAMDDSERCHGQWLLNGPRERRPWLRVCELVCDPQLRRSPRLHAYYLLSGPRKRYTRQTLHPIHIRRSGPIRLLIELRAMYGREDVDRALLVDRASKQNARITLVRIFQHSQAVR